MSRFEPRPKTIFLKLVLGCFVFLDIFILVFIWGSERRKGLEVIFFDVGQGDSIFIETKDKFQVLIDGGPDLVVLEKLAKEMPFYDRTIDLIILTHPDHDHIFGLLEVLKRYRIENILWTGVVKDSTEWREWKKLIENEGAELLIAEAGQKIILEGFDSSKEQGPYILVLHPFENLEGRKFKYYNDTSVVAKLVFRDISFLFTGDISKKIEKKLIEKTEERTEGISSSVLKVAHHGSKFSSSEEFLESVAPEIAIISVGENNYNQPDSGVLANLEKFDIKALITKEEGDIKVFSDGKNFQIKY